MSWQEVELGSLLRIDHGFAFKGEYFGDVGDYIVLTPGNFHEQGGFRPRPGKDRRYAAAFPERYLLRENDLIVAMTEQGEGLLGSAALVPTSDTYLHNQRIGLVRIDENRANKRFIYYLFNTPSVREQIRNSSSGAKVRHTSPERMYRVRARVPSPTEQAKVAAILASLDDLIANNQRRVALLESMAEEIYREWFVRMRFPGAKPETFRKGYPASWSHAPIAKAFKFYGGATPSKHVQRYWADGDVHWFTPTDITRANSIYLEASSEQCTEEGLQNCSANLFPPYSIMMTSRATIGAIGINCEAACTNQGFVTCIPNERYRLTYLYHWLKLAKPHFEMLSGGATFAELTKGTFKRIHILTPDENIVARFETLARPLFDEIEVLIKATQKLRNTRDALLPRLISGKLRVDQLDIHYPPSMLAEQDAAAEP